MPEEFNIDYLSNHPEFIPALAQALHREWGRILKNEKINDRVEKLKNHLSQDKLPIAWVAYRGGKILGTASLRLQDLEGYENLTPWLGGVFVSLRERGHGIGTALCRVVEEKAFGMGHRRLYLFTLDKVDWYRMRGWKLKCEVPWHGYPGVLMEKEIG